MPNIIVWADIPVRDLDRAMRFYSHVIGQPAMKMPGSGDVAVLGAPGSGEGPVVSFDLYVGGTPSVEGTTAYLGANGDMDDMIARVREAGGEVLQEKRFMGDMVGWIAFIKDTEGNRIGIQQPGEGEGSVRASRREGR